MEELTKFINLLKRNKLILIIVPVATVIITFFLVRNLPDSYVSQAQIATGIVDETKQTGFQQETLQTQQIIQEFSNLLAVMKMKRILDQVSYQLMIHDLNAADPFRKPSKLLAAMSAAQRQELRESYLKLYNSNTALNLYNAEQKKLYDLMVSMRYDSETLKERVQAFRSGDSDFIVVMMESEDPDLSAFTVNTLAAEFIKYYSKAVKVNQVKTSDFLRDLLAQKSDSLISKMNSLRDYKVKNRVLNLDEQSKQLYARIIDYENKRQEAVQQTSSYAGALNGIDAKFKPGERKYIEAAMSNLNQDIIATKDDIKGLYRLYYENDLDEQYKTSIDSLSQILARQINNSSDAYITNPLNTKQELIGQKITLETQLDISRYSINSLERELGKLNAQFDQLVPREADVQRLGMDIDMASKEYSDILNKYNQSNLENAFDVKLNLAQPAMSGLPQPSKKMLLVLISGVISVIFCLLIFFIIYYVDTSIVSAKELANATQIPVLGSLRNLNSASVNLNDIWINKDEIKPYADFKRQLRSIRYEIENEIKGKVIAIASVDAAEGKTLLARSLAFAWKMTNHKVLLIDGNFTNQELSKSASDSISLEDFIQGKVVFDQQVIKEGSIYVMRNQGGDSALLELDLQQNIGAKLTQLKDFFDIIIIDTSSQDDMNNLKEWMLFSDGVIGVFKCGQRLTETKKGFIAYLRENPSFKGWILNRETSKES
jgi:succinoglycan biosynthesis transport protein ExoP